MEGLGDGSDEKVFKYEDLCSDPKQPHENTGICQESGHGIGQHRGLLASQSCSIELQMQWDPVFQESGEEWQRPLDTCTPAHTTHNT